MTEPLHSPDEVPIIERIKSLISPADALALSQQIEHDITTRIHQIMLVSHAHLIAQLRDAEQAVTDSAELSRQATQAASDSVDLAEGASQAVMDSGDEIDAHSDLIITQKIHRKQMVKFAGKQADAQQIAQTTDVLFSGDPVSIQHVLEIMNLPKVTIAARSMRKHRIAELVDALLKATEGW